jgi:hypothetical protein
MGGVCGAVLLRLLTRCYPVRKLLIIAVLLAAAMVAFLLPDRGGVFALADRSGPPVRITASDLSLINGQQARPGVKVCKWSIDELD